MSKKLAVKQLGSVKLQNGHIKFLDDGKKFLSIDVPISGGYASTVLFDKRSLKALRTMITKILRK